MFQGASISFFLFIAVYFEVFMLLTLFERHKEITAPSPLANTDDPKLPSVTIVVPCFNEQGTIIKTVESLLALDYPKHKLFVSIVDDGSTDDTWQYVEKFTGHPQVSAYKKTNGGKYTALNYGIERATTDLVGCLDADSFVSNDALRKIVKKFQDDPKTMAVAPAVKIWKPDNILRGIQYVEYIYGILIKKLFGLLEAIHVTPGPFSIFRKEVFKEIGLFKHAHNTEDMEIALRMHDNDKKIDNCHDAFVYTVGPDTFRKLHRQRLRWTYGFMRNAFDYKHLFFNRKKGNVGFLTLPFSIASLLGLVATVVFFALNFGNKATEYIEKWRVVGFNFKLPSFHYDFFFAPITTLSIMAFVSAIIAIGMLIASQFLLRNHFRIRDFILYLLLYPLFAMTWILRSVFNVALAKGTSWR